jgi:glutamate synthase (NADPH) large chain
MIRDAAALFEHGEKMQLQYNIRNTHRAIGTKISSLIVRKFGMEGLQPGHLSVRLRGSAGQSLGAFAVRGLKLVVFGDANDYVGKGLSGGTIVVRPVPSSTLVWDENAIIGNTVLYGATAGELYAGGQAGERFAVRNSGATAVVEGCGANGCEYMTGGTVAILGPVGDNFGAGFTGGMAFLYDPGDAFEQRVNPDTVLWSRVAQGHWDAELRALIGRHVAETGSRLAARILNDWEGHRGHFWHVVPKEYARYLPVPMEGAQAATVAAE